MAPRWLNEITEAADVGFGSFYNHFTSKEAMHDQLLDQLFEEFADVLDRVTSGITDPAEVLASPSGTRSSAPGTTRRGGGCSCTMASRADSSPVVSAPASFGTSSEDSRRGASRRPTH